MPDLCLPPALYFPRQAIVDAAGEYGGPTTGNAYFRIPLGGPRVRCVLGIFWEPLSAAGGGAGASWQTWSPRGSTDAGSQQVSLGLEYGQTSREGKTRLPEPIPNTMRAAGSLYGSLYRPLVWLDGANDERYRGHYGQEVLSAHDAILGRLQIVVGGFTAGSWMLQVAHFPEVGLSECDWEQIRREIRQPEIVAPLSIIY